MNRNWNAGFDIGSSSELLVNTTVRISKPWLTRATDMSGLRARMEAGFSRMNDVTVIQASQVPRINKFRSNKFKHTLQGLCAYVCKMVGNAKTRGILIGYDHRRNSERFAHLTAAAFIHEGVKVYLHQRIVHTPLYA